MIVKTFAGSREEPPEYESTSPVRCFECGEEWDEDDESDEFIRVAGTVYCKGPCARKRRKEMEG